MRVFLSGSTYHVAACAGFAPRGFARCHAHIVTDRSGRPLINRFQANNFEVQLRRMASPDVNPSVVPSGYGPRSLNLAYNPAVTPTYPTGVGSNSTIVAIVDAFGYTQAERDLGIYRKQFGLPPCTKANGCFIKLNQAGVAGSYPPQDDGWAQESALDVDMASAMCPNCKIMLVEATTNSFTNLATAVNTAVSKGAHVVSNSYGGGEAGSTTVNGHYHHGGVAITASSGDDAFAAGPQFPATSQYVTAVGGTALTFVPATGFSQKVWFDGSHGAGSGCSTIYPKPAWQHDPLCTKRMEADVSAVADPATGVAVYGPTSGTSSAWLVFGGTSVSAPLVGGIYGAHGATVTLGSPYGASVHLTDVKTGNNGTCGGTYFCQAKVGYDGPTGLGTPTGEVGF
jgi:subtilase family serine protease